VKLARQRFGGDWVVDGDGEPAIGIRGDEPYQPGAVRSDQRVSDQHISDAARSEHFRLGERGALVFDDARVECQFDDLACLVGLDVRPQSRRIADDADGVGDVAADDVGVEDQPGAEDRVDVGEFVRGVHRFERLCNKRLSRASCRALPVRVFP
jgi:hypothetical protein